MFHPIRATLAALLVCIFLPAFGEDSPACGDARSEMKIPLTAQVGGEEDTANPEFLFSEDGDDLYLATSFDPARQTLAKLLGIGSGFQDVGGVHILVVYQSEQAREQAIQNLTSLDALLVPVVGHHEPLANLKYAVIHLLPDLSKLTSIVVRTKYTERDLADYDLPHLRWYIAGISYFEPRSCDLSGDLDMCSSATGQLFRCVLPGLRATSTYNNWIGDMKLKCDGPFRPGCSASNPPLEPYGDAQFSRLAEVLRKRVIAFAERTREP
jgi:hypothetical protein